MWIHLPSIPSAYAVGTAGSSLDCKALSLAARSATLNTKSVSQASLRRAWQTRPSIRLLSGLISEPSILNRGVAEWISSLEVSHASHIQSLAESSTAQTPESFRGRSSESPPDLDTQLSFSRTCQASSDFTGIASAHAFKRWDTELRKAYSARQKLARLTAGSDSLSWPTPNTMDSLPPRSEEANRERFTTGQRAGRTAPDNLREYVQPEMHPANWPTPAARDHKGFDSPGKQNARQDPAMYLSSLLGQTMQRDGHTCSTSCRRLSPRFAENLMGLPHGWVNSSEPLEMASFQAWRLELSRRSLYS